MCRKPFDGNGFGWLVLLVVVLMDALDLILWTLAVSNSLPFAWSMGCLCLYMVLVMATAQDKVMGLSTPRKRRIETKDNLMVHA